MEDDSMTQEQQKSLTEVNSHENINKSIDFENWISDALPAKNRFEFRLHEQKYRKQLVIFDSDFDSGNCKNVEQISDLNVELYFLFR